MSFEPSPPDDHRDHPSDLQDADAASSGGEQPTGGDELARIEEVAVADAAPRVPLPHPNFGFAILWAALPVVIQMLVAIAVGILATLVFVAVTQRPQDVSEFAKSLNAYLVPVGTLTTTLVALAVSRLILGRNWVRRLGVRNMDWAQWCCAVLMVAPLAIVASEIGNCVSGVLDLVEPDWLRSIRESGAELFLMFVHLPWWFVFVGGCLLPGLGEEIYCRGFLSRGLVARHGVLLGSILAAFLFGVMHLDPLQSLTAFVLGLGLQFVFLTTRSLWAPILVHALNNAAAFATMRYYEVFPIPGVSRLPDGSIVHTPSFLLTASVAAMLATGWLLYQLRTRWCLPDGSAWSPGYVTAEVPPAELQARPARGRPNLVLVVTMIWTQLLLVLAVFAANHSVS
jgi:membrane protease YdiL (CAAX protease family)